MKEEHKQLIYKWREENKEKYLEYQKAYHAEHKEEILKKMLEPTMCACGFTCGKTNLLRHQKSKLHEKRLNKLFKV